MKNYIAVTYDVCEHNQLFEEMNTYPLDPAGDFDSQVRVLAKQDIAPVIRVFEDDDYKLYKLYKEYKFTEYECDCVE